MTPYAVLCLFAASAGGIFSDIDTILQLLLLVGIIYAVSFFHAYIFNGVLIKFVAKLNPIAFFKKIFQAQATAFTTQSSIGTLPVSIDALERRVGVSEEIYFHLESDIDYIFDTKSNEEHGIKAMEYFSNLSKSPRRFPSLMLRLFITGQRSSPTAGAGKCPSAI